MSKFRVITKETSAALVQQFIAMPEEVFRQEMDQVHRDVIHHAHAIRVAAETARLLKIAASLREKEQLINWGLENEN